MPCLNNSAISSRSAAAISALKRKLRNSTGQWEASELEQPGGVESDSADASENELSSAEDFILMQPKSGWVEAERKPHGYSKTNSGETPQSKWYYNK